MPTIGANGTIKVDDQVIAEAVRKAAADEVQHLIRQGVILDQLMQILNDQWFQQKELLVLGGGESDWIVVNRSNQTGVGKGKLFQHVSLIAAVEFALKWQPDAAPSDSYIRYEVISGPSPEYQRGDLSGRMGIYAVVKLEDDRAPEIVKIFDGVNSAGSRQEAYRLAGELSERAAKERAEARKAGRE